MRLIDADALDMYECLRSYYGDAWRDAQKAIDDAPTVDAVEVVRCEDCRWFENDGYHTNCQIMRFCVEAKDYCSRGERREDDSK